MAANGEARRKAILRALKEGNTRTAAASAAGIHKDTFYEWLKSDPTFSDAVEKAEADAELFYVGVVTHQANAGQWTAAAWWLERRRHEDWKKRDEREVRLYTDAELVTAAAGALAGDGSAGADVSEFDD